MIVFKLTLVKKKLNGCIDLKQKSVWNIKNEHIVILIILKIFVNC